jgi:hypothetical protein
MARRRRGGGTLPKVDDADLAAVPAPSLETGPDEDELRIEEATAMMVSGAPGSSIKKQLQKKYAIGITAATRILRAARERMLAETAAERPFTKAVQARRLIIMINDARKRGNFSAVAGFEQMLAKIQGNFEPVQIDVHQHQEMAIEDELQRFSEEDEVRELVEKYDEMERDAEVGRALMAGKKDPEDDEGGKNDP